MTQGNLKNITLDIDLPITFKSTLELNNLNLLTGLNGTGKSFILVNTWCLGHLVAYAVAAKMHKLPLNLLEYSQYVYDNSTNCDETTGTIVGEFENCTVSIEFSKGKIIKSEITNQDKLDEIWDSIYMSSHMRTFLSMDAYAKQRSSLLKKHSYQEVVELMTKDYRLYDVFFMERLMMKLPLMIFIDTKEQLKTFDFPDDLELLDFDEGGFFVKFMEDEEKRYVSKHYGAGHQSLLNMALAQQK